MGRTAARAAHFSTRCILASSLEMSVVCYSSLCRMLEALSCGQKCSFDLSSVKVCWALWPWLDLELGKLQKYFLLSCSLLDARSLTFYSGVLWNFVFRKDIRIAAAVAWVRGIWISQERCVVFRSQHRVFWSYSRVLCSMLRWIFWFGYSSTLLVYIQLFVFLTFIKEHMWHSENSIRM